MNRSESSAPVPCQFSQSSTPYDTEITYMEPQEHKLNNGCDEFNDHEESWLDDSHLSVGGCMRKLDGKRHRLLHKFVAKVEKDVETLVEFRGYPVPDTVENFEENGATIMERGLDNDFLASDGVKLERFRVKTINIAGVVVKDDEDQ